MRTIMATRLADIGPTIGGWHVINTSVDFSGNLLLLASERPVAYSARTSNRYRIYRGVHASASFIDLGETQEAYVTAAPFSARRWLVAGWRREPENVAQYGFRDRYHIFSQEGVLLQSFNRPKVGRIQTTREGRIWAGYHDVAILSGDGVASQGVVCFSETGAILFGYNGWLWFQGGKSLFGAPANDPDAGPTGIIECYALNVSADRLAWLYYLDDGFPLVQITDLTVSRVWPAMPVHGARAFAVHDSRALLAGSYDEKGTLFLVNLDSLQVEPLQPVDEHGMPIQFRWESFGRAERLYLLDGHSIFLVDIAGL